MAVKKKAATKQSSGRARVKAPTRPSGNRTKATAASVEAFIAAVPNEARRKDAKTALALMKKATGETPKMWGPSIVGFGSHHYKYESGHEGDTCLAGFSPRANATVFYVMGGVPDTDPLWKKLGKFKTGKACVYVNRLEDVDLGVLEKIITKSVAELKKTQPPSRA